MKKVAKTAIRNSTDGMHFLIIGIDDHTNRSYYVNTGSESTRNFLKRYTDDLLNERAQRIGKKNVKVNAFTEIRNIE